MASENDRERRLAAALRENLKRRKAQIQRPDESDQTSPDAATAPDDDQTTRPKTG